LVFDRLIVYSNKSNFIIFASKFSPRLLKIDTMNTIKECFDIILSGEKSESRFAARRVRKLLYSATATSGREKFIDMANLIKNAPREYEKISEEWRQENFVLAVSVIYFMHDRESQPDFLFLWLFKLLDYVVQDPETGEARMYDKATAR